MISTSDTSEKDVESGIWRWKRSVKESNCIFEEEGDGVVDKNNWGEEQARTEEVDKLKAFKMK